MFDKIKQLKQLKEMHDIISQEKVEIEKEGVRVVINGKLELEEVKINPNLSKEEQEKILKECFNQAIKKVQMNIAQKMSGMM